METMFVAFGVFLMVVVGMAVGVIFQGKRITGSCGGLGAIDGVDQCGVCGRNFDDVDVDACDGVPKLRA
ncbi:MAG: (Na+)-NQR maturation NqrM [Sedimentitalea sp.]|uniref:(Na+)-NQR maturation NqrM n=1 Tax=Sedimentitalea sp. TaxID=2048915 RepID=UPI003266DED1